MLPRALWLEVTGLYPLSLCVYLLSLFLSHSLCLSLSLSLSGPLARRHISCVFSRDGQKMGNSNEREGRERDRGEQGMEREEVCVSIVMSKD